MTRWEEHDVAETDDARRLSRRAILRRGAVVGGTATALWAAPQLATRALAAEACGTPPCFCGVYTLDSSCPGTWGGGTCNGGTLPSDCGGSLNCGLPTGYGFTISTTSTTVVVTLDKLDDDECGWEFADAWIYLSDCGTPQCTQATLSGSPCERTATFTYSGGVPSNIEDCFELYFKLCGCADS